MKTNKYKVSVNGIPYEVEIEPMTATNQVTLDNNLSSTLPNTITPTVAAQVPLAQSKQVQTSVPSNEPGESVMSPMQGKIVKVAVSIGQLVKSGQVIAVLEAMKMENEIMAARDARIIHVHVQPGQSVEANDILVTLA